MLDFKCLSVIFPAHSILATGTLGYESQIPSSFSVSSKRIPCISECLVH